MKLKLDFPIPESSQKITLGDAIYLMGSCFSDEIGDRLLSDKFEVLANPFGTVYNPSSICKLITGTLSMDQIMQSQGVFYHWDAHSTIGNTNKQALKTQLGEQLSRSSAFQKKAKWLILTLGTAWVYRLKATDEIVANCHKVPLTSFTKELLSIDQINEQMDSLLSTIRKDNPLINVILTVSPVRHIRDGLIENNRSKARLLEAVHRLASSHAHVSYFPSYEILIDELRDHRHYNQDMIHPSSEAVDYIYERFVTTYFDEKATSFLNQWRPIKAALTHRSFYPDSPKHQAFLKDTLKKLQALNETVPVSKEIDQIKEQLQ